MDKPVFHFLSRPKIEEPVFVGGLPGLGNVGKMAASMLIKSTKAKPFVELYSPSFPDYVIVDSNGVCRPPRYEFYFSFIGRTGLIILTGDTQSSFEDVAASYGLCDEIIKFVGGYGCRFIVTMDGFASASYTESVHVAATSPELALEATKRGAVIFQERISGAAGLLLGLAKHRGWDGLCLLGTAGVGADRKAALSVLRFLMELLERGSESFTGPTPH